MSEVGAYFKTFWYAFVNVFLLFTFLALLNFGTESSKHRDKSREEGRRHVKF